MDFEFEFNVFYMMWEQAVAEILEKVKEKKAPDNFAITIRWKGVEYQGLPFYNPTDYIFRWDLTRFDYVCSKEKFDQRGVPAGLSSLIVHYFYNEDLVKVYSMDR